MDKKDKKTKIEYMWSLMCTGSTVDKETNNLSLFNIIEQLNLNINKQIKPYSTNGESTRISMDFNVIVFFRLLEKIKDSFEIRIDFLDPVGISLNKVEHNVSIHEGVKNIRLITRFNKMFISIPGIYDIIIGIREVGNKHFKNVGHIPVAVNIKNNIK